MSTMSQQEGPARRTRRGNAVALTLGLITAVSCGGSDVGTGPEEEPEAPSFSQDVNEIFVQNGCTAGNCHGGNAGNLTLTAMPATSYANLVDVAASREPALLRVKPEDSFNSYLVIKLENRQSSGSSMPLGGQPLSAADLATIKSWIDAGATNN
jgi:hypothetical protein